MKGLVDAGETPEHAAIRELKEETGFEAEEIIESSNIMVNDPGPLFLYFPDPLDQSWNQG